MTRVSNLLDQIGDIMEENVPEIEVIEAKDHAHEYKLDESGFGLAEPKEGSDHTHSVIGFYVVPCTEDSHTHSIELPEEWER